MADRTGEVVLSTQELREVTGWAAESAQEVLEVFESAHPGDPRPRTAVDAARTFARGGDRGKALRDTAWAAMRAARDADTPAAGDAARAAMAAAGAAYLHPLADAHQVKHILGAAAHAARAAELTAGGDRDVGADHIERAPRRALHQAVPRGSGWWRARRGAASRFGWGPPRPFLKAQLYPAGVDRSAAVPPNG